MFIKTITTKDEQELDTKYNQFAKTHNVRFSQSHFNVVDNDGFITMFYSIVIFYESDEGTPTNVSTEILKETKNTTRNSTVQFKAINDNCRNCKFNGF